MYSSLCWDRPKLPLRGSDLPNSSDGGTMCCKTLLSSDYVMFVVESARAAGCDLLPSWGLFTGSSVTLDASHQAAGDWCSLSCRFLMAESGFLPGGSLVTDVCSSCFVATLTHRYCTCWWHKSSLPVSDNILLLAQRTYLGSGRICVDLTIQRTMVHVIFCSNTFNW